MSSARTNETDTSRDEEEKATSSSGMLGLEQQTQRYISPIEIVAVGWNICNSWVTIIALLGLALYQGGSVTLLYGMILIFVMYGCIVFTMAELASVYPTAGGPYHWTAILCPPAYSRVVSYACGMINIFSWLAIAVGVIIILAQVLLGIVIFYDSSYVNEPWHDFLIYQAIGFLMVLHNIFTVRHSMWTFTAGFGLSLVCYFVMMIVCVSRATKRESNAFVWTEFTNETGWDNKGVVFFIGLLTPNYMYAGIDGAIHLAEECTNAATTVPQALLSTWLVGFITAFTFTIAMLYSIQDFTAVLATPTGFPIYEIFAQATGSGTAATVFTAVLIVIGTIALAGIEQTASRLTWAFARDNALIFSKQVGHIHKTLEAPVWAIIANGFVILVIGCIYLGSTTAFNAFVGTGVILQLVTFAFPASFLLMRRRSSHFLPPNRGFKLPSVVGWIANIMTIAFAFVGLVFYDFPAVRPATSSNMNYASAIIGIMALFAVLNWFIWARRHYHGPKLE